MRLKHLAAFLTGYEPSSSLICSTDSGDDPGAGGGAPPAAPPPAPAPPASPPMTFTPDQLAYIEAEKEKARNNGAAAARRALEGRQPKQGETPQPKTPEPTAPAAPDALAILKLRDDFDDAVSDMTLNGAQKKFIRELVMDKRPPDVAAYVRTISEQLGLGKPATPTPPAASPTPATPAAVPPMPGGAPPARVITDDTPIMSMSRADQAALAKRMGPFAFKQRLMTELAASGQRFSLRR